MKHITFLWLILTATLTGKAQSFTKNDLVGDWYVEGKEAIVSINPANDKFYGFTKWMKQPNNADKTPKLDLKNSDPVKRAKPILGSTMLDNLTYSGANTWEGGTIYDARSGKSYACKITMVNKNTLKVRGYIGLPLIGSTTTWSQVHQ